MSKIKKSVHFISLGCPKNLVDTEMMLGTLNKDGYAVSEAAEEVETIINRDCSMYFWVSRRFKTRPLGLDKVY